ncbi:MAG: ISNCY family transposase [Candidatus Babeliales bacterium]|nr:ISNCY family transposase [Candidatus Babeliales bacterium]
MSRKEVEQIKVFERILRGDITQSIAAQMLEMSDRQVRSKLKRYKDAGAKGLVHKSRGKRSPHKWKPEQKALALDLLRSEWKGFGPTFTAEKLEELHGIKVSKETVRQAMIQAGIWLRKRGRSKHRRRRERKECIGILVQLDGSPHDWFEGRGPRCTLLVFIDDATSQILWLEFVDSESVEGLMQATRKYMTKFGRPVSFYVDWGSVFSVNTNNPDHKKLSQFERAMEELGVIIIHANSPQAKGRVERSNSTHQDRLIKEMRLAGISSMEQANKFVQEGYIEKHNKKFAVAPSQSINAHRSIDGFDFDAIFCLKETRSVANDFVITYNNRLFQLNKQQKVTVRPRNIVTVSEYFDGSIKLSIRGVLLSFSEISVRPTKPKPPKVYKDPRPHRVHPNSRRWNGGIIPIPFEPDQTRSNKL